MASFLERYQQGECVEVWADLQRLGAQIPREPFWSDALAVARETMRRARYNIELLIPRLQAEGYVFGNAWMEKLAQAEEDMADLFTSQMRATLPSEQLTALAAVYREREQSSALWHSSLRIRLPHHHQMSRSPWLL